MNSLSFSVTMLIPQANTMCPSPYTASSLLSIIYSTSVIVKLMHVPGSAWHSRSIYKPKTTSLTAQLKKKKSLFKRSTFGFTMLALLSTTCMHALYSTSRMHALYSTARMHALYSTARMHALYMQYSTLARTIQYSRQAHIILRA